MVRSAPFARVSNHESRGRPSRRGQGAAPQDEVLSISETVKTKMASSSSPVPDERIPVMVGVGETADHPAELTAGLEPMALLEAAVRRAGQDAGAPILGDIDSLDVVNFLSWRYRDPEKLLASRLGITPKHCVYGPVGGESPIRLLHEAAQRIARGEAKVAVVC